MKHISFNCLVFCKKLLPSTPTVQSFLLLVSMVLFQVRIGFSQNGNCNFLCNMDFEQPGVPAGNFRFINQSQVPCWKTTATDAAIEIWGNNFLGVPAFSGNNFAELNATQVSTLYQNFKAPLGETVTISFAHRGRAGTDVMSVSVGPVGGPYTTLGNFSATRNAWVFNQISYTFPSAGPQNYSLRFNSVSAAGGATVGNFIDAVSVTLPNPVIKLTTKNPSCSGALDGRITARVTGGTGPYVFQWASPVNSIDSVAKNLTEGYYSLVVTDYYGCKASGNSTLTASNKPLDDTIKKELCPGEKYITRKGKSVSQAGIYTDTVKGINCDSVFIQIISYATAPKINAQIPPNGCVGDEIGLGVSSVNGWDYIWLFGADASKTNANTAGPHYVSWSKSGEKTVSISVSKNGCLFPEIFKQVIKINELSVRELNVSICDGDSYSLNGKKFYTQGRYADTIKITNGCDSVLMLNLTLYDKYASEIKAEICAGEKYVLSGRDFDKEGVYPIMLNSLFGCDSLINLSLTVRKPEAKFSVSEQLGCTTTEFLFQNTSIRPLKNVIWDFGNGKTDFGDEVKMIFNSAGEYTVTLTITDTMGCKAQTTRNNLIRVSPGPKAGFYFPENIFENNPLVRISDASEGAVSWQYILSDGFEYEVSDFNHNFKNPGNYQIIQRVTNALGCVDTISATVTVFPVSSMFVPNSFSPNQDGTNDIFFARGKMVMDFELRIFNRWGDEIFFSDDINNGWDGTFKGMECPQDVYVYRILWADHLKTDRSLLGRITLWR